MAALQAQNLLLLSSPSLPAPRRRTFHASLHNPVRVGTPSPSFLKLPKELAVEELILREGRNSINISGQEQASTSGAERDDLVSSKLYAVMEAAADRAGMHDAIGAQRGNWNTLLLNSLNSMTLAASIAAGLSAIPAGGSHQLAFKASAVLLYSAATAISIVVNKIQPSQLVEEQRNAARLFRQLEKRIQTTLAISRPTAADVEEAMERVLALDKAYPLGLLPGMLEKFPKTVEPTVWWPKFGLRRRQQPPVHRRTGRGERNGGWSGGLEHVLTGVLRSLKKNDTVEYVKLGKLVLRINTVLAMSGPLLTGLAAIGASLVDSGSSAGTWPLMLGVVGGSLAMVVNTLEHGGQVGMVFELYRNCAGFYRQLEEEIELNLGEDDVERREDGELFELKTALQLGRSMEELRGLSSYSCSSEEDVREYAGKLF